MNFKSITIQGFRTFIEKQTFCVDDIEDKTLNYVTGENKVETSLEGNDVGKSSLFEALCFCLYGTTSTKLRAGDVANWNKSKKCFVQVVFEKNKTTYVLCRQWNHNKLILGGLNSTIQNSEITQDDLENLIGLNFSGFLYSVFISQFTSQFFDLDPMDKLKVFSDMLRLEDWLDRSEKAKVKAKDIKGNIESAINEKYKLEGKLDVLNGQSYDKDIDKWDSDKKEKMDSLKDKDSTLKNVKKELSVTKKELDSELSSLTADFSAFEIKAVKSKKEATKIVEACFQAGQIISKHEGSMVEIKKVIKKFESVKNTCPYCDQKVSEKYLRDQLRDLDVRYDEIKGKSKALEHNRKLLQEKEDKAIKVSHELDDKFSDMRDDMNDARRELSVLKAKISMNKEAMDNLQGDIDGVQKESNPYIKLKRKNVVDKKDINALLNKMENTLEDLNKKYSLYEFWVKGFKDVRLFVVSQALQEFEICINNNLQRLGLNEWLVKLSVERDVNKGRSVRRGFSVEVQSPYNDRFVSFKCWGGGVSQRLRLAGTMGLIDLIRSRTGAECNIEVWDEPSQFLSPEGIDDLISVLKDRSVGGCKKVFLIDHRDLSSHSLFNSIIFIEKRKSGSFIIKK